MKTSSLFCILTAAEAAGFPRHSPILPQDGGHKETHVSVLPLSAKQQTVQIKHHKRNEF